MIWNTIVHPRMMDDESGTSNEPSAFDNGSFSPIKFANPHKLSFYDVIIVISELIGDQAVNTLVKGDFETLKRMLENDEAICAARFAYAHSGSMHQQDHIDYMGFTYNPDTNTITLRPASYGEVLYLHSDNTITNSPTP